MGTITQACLMPDDLARMQSFPQRIVVRIDPRPLSTGTRMMIGETIYDASGCHLAVDEAGQLLPPIEPKTFERYQDGVRTELLVIEGCQRRVGERLPGFTYYGRPIADYSAEALAWIVMDLHLRLHDADEREMRSSTARMNNLARFAGGNPVSEAAAQQFSPKQLAKFADGPDTGLVLRRPIALEWEVTELPAGVTAGARVIGPGSVEFIVQSTRAAGDGWILCGSPVDPLQALCEAKFTPEKP